MYHAQVFTCVVTAVPVYACVFTSVEVLVLAITPDRVGLAMATVPEADHPSVKSANCSTVLEESTKPFPATSVLGPPVPVKAEELPAPDATVRVSCASWIQPVVSEAVTPDLRPTALMFT